MSGDAKDSKDLVKKGSTDIDQVPGFLAGAGMTGFEGADIDTYTVPFLYILQSNSPQLLEDADEYIEGAKPGMFFNNVTGQVYGKSIEVIPVTFQRTATEWTPGTGDRRLGKFAGMHSIPEATDIGEGDFYKGMAIREGHENAGNFLVDTRTFTLLVIGEEEQGPIMFSLTSTGIQHAKAWMTKANMLKLKNADGKMVTPPLFSSAYRLTTSLNENELGKWYQVGTKKKSNIERIGWISEQQYSYVQDVVELIASKGLEVDFGASQTEERDVTDSGNTAETDAF